MGSYEVVGTSCHVKVCPGMWRERQVYVLNFGLIFFPNKIQCIIQSPSHLGHKTEAPLSLELDLSNFWQLPMLISIRDLFDSVLWRPPRLFLNISCFTVSFGLLVLFVLSFHWWQFHWWLHLTYRRRRIFILLYLVDIEIKACLSGLLGEVETSGNDQGTYVSLIKEASVTLVD